MNADDVADISAAEVRPELHGLTESEAATRLAEYGPNRLNERRTRRLDEIALQALREPMFLLLLAAVTLYFALGDMAEALFLLLGAAATIGLAIGQEARSERALAALRRLAEPTVSVVRGGVERRIPAAELVPGDIFLVGEGVRAPADGILVAGDVLSVEEAVLTGEAAPVVKRPGSSTVPGADEETQVFAGTLVVRGQGVSLAIRTGAATRIGRIGASLSAIEEGPSALQTATRGVVVNLGLFALVVAATVLGLYGLFRHDWVGGALASLTIAIALIPEEFPMVLVIFMALGAWRLARHNVLVRRSAVIETLGATTLLCVDKTGTITKNQMALRTVWRAGTAHDLAGELLAEPRVVVEAAQLASAVRPHDPMDVAVHAAAGARDGFGLLRSYPLRPEFLAVVQVWQSPAGGRWPCAITAPVDPASVGLDPLALL